MGQARVLLLIFPFYCACRNREDHACKGERSPACFGFRSYQRPYTKLSFGPSVSALPCTLSCTPGSPQQHHVLFYPCEQAKMATTRRLCCSVLHSITCCTHHPLYTSIHCTQLYTPKMATATLLCSVLHSICCCTHQPLYPSIPIPHGVVT